MSNGGGRKCRLNKKMNAGKNTQAMVLVHPSRATALFGDALEAEQEYIELNGMNVRILEERR